MPDAVFVPMYGMKWPKKKRAAVSSGERDVGPYWFTAIPTSREIPSKPA
jgi:hypothetical protein